MIWVPEKAFDAATVPRHFPGAAVLDFTRDAKERVVLYGRDAMATAVVFGGYTPSTYNGEVNRPTQEAYLIHRLRLNIDLLTAIASTMTDWRARTLTSNQVADVLDKHDLRVRNYGQLRIFEFIPREIVSIENQAAFEAALAAYRSTIS